VFCTWGQTRAKQRDIWTLLDSDTQIILLGLTLIADDEGRGLAQARFLVRQFDKDVALIKQALTTLTEIGFLVCCQTIDRFC
jgi:hypothetical protein